MRTFGGIGIAILSLLGIVSIECQARRPITKTLYLLEDAKHQQWCAFREEADWKREVESLSAMVVATVNYIDGRISAVSVTEQDEAGDWIVYDHYSLDERGTILKLKRTINILPGDRSEDEVYVVLGGIARKQSIATRKLSTGERVLPSNEWLPDVPIATRVEAFPFFPLTGSQGLEASSKGRSCIPVDPK